MILFTSAEFNYIELSDAVTTGSSIMPQKKNSDMAELVRGKTGRVYGNLINILTLLKGLPLAYNKDMQEDKELIFDSIDTVKNSLNIFIEMLSTMKINEAKMRDDASTGFINATDLADYLVTKGMAFRDAYKISGEIVNYCINKNYTLENLPIDVYKKYSKLFDKDVYNFIDLDTCVKRRTSHGGASPKNIDKQIEYLKK
jgi:argininosuccinate lyase